MLIQLPYDYDHDGPEFLGKSPSLKGAKFRNLNFLIFHPILMLFFFFAKSSFLQVTFESLMKICYFYWDGTKRGGNIGYLEGIQNFHFDVLFALNWLWHGFQLAFQHFQYQLELWVTSLSDTPRLQYYDVHTLEYRYISKLPMKNERIWSYVKETTSHLQNKLIKNIHLGVATSTRPPFSWKYKLNYFPF